MNSIWHQNMLCLWISQDTNRYHAWPGLSLATLWSQHAEVTRMTLSQASGWCLDIVAYLWENFEKYVQIPFRLQLCGLIMLLSSNHLHHFHSFSKFQEHPSIATHASPATFFTFAHLKRAQAAPLPLVAPLFGCQAWFAAHVAGSVRWSSPCLGKEKNCGHPWKKQNVSILLLSMFILLFEVPYPTIIPHHTTKKDWTLGSGIRPVRGNLSSAIIIFSIMNNDCS